MNNFYRMTENLHPEAPTETPVNCAECSKLYDVKCGICDAVIEQTTHQCPKHVTSYMICGPIGRTCDQCESKGFIWASGWGGAPHVIKDGTNYWLEELPLKPLI